MWKKIDPGTKNNKLEDLCGFQERQIAQREMYLKSELWKWRYNWVCISRVYIYNQGEMGE